MNGILLKNYKSQNLSEINWGMNNSDKSCSIIRWTMFKASMILILNIYTNSSDA